MKQTKIVTLVINREQLTFILGTFNAVISTLAETNAPKTTVILPTSLNDIALISRDSTVRNYYRSVDFYTTDGMPLVWLFARKFPFIPIDRVYGPSIIEHLTIKNCHAKQLIFCAHTSEAIQISKLFAKDIEKGKKKIEVLGSIKDTTEHERVIKIIESYKPFYTWIGVGSPNQVFLANSIKKYCKHPSLIFCVGVGVEYLAKTRVQAPKLLQNNGLEWLFRLITNPKRLYARYLFAIPHFLLSVLLKKTKVSIKRK